MVVNSFLEYYNYYFSSWLFLSVRRIVETFSINYVIKFKLNVVRDFVRRRSSLGVGQFSFP